MTDDGRAFSATGKNQPRSSAPGFCPQSLGETPSLRASSGSAALRPARQRFRAVAIAEFREKFLHSPPSPCAATGRSSCTLPLAGNADFRANKPVSVAGEMDRLLRDLRRRRELHHEQHFVVITINLNVARLAQLERDRPLDRPGFPAGRQVPFDLGRDAGVARDIASKCASREPSSGVARP